MVTYPLLVEGRDVIGVDLDRPSIDYGRNLLRAAGLGADRLVCAPLESVQGQFDVIIVSEVLEHQHEPQEVLDVAVAKLRPGGSLLITVPNGYGWFELESALWHRLGLGRLLELLRIRLAISAIRLLLTRGYRDAVHPSSLDSSPHVQRFTIHSIAELARAQGLDVEEATGTAMFAGPFSATLFTGFIPLMRVNTWLGSRFPAAASGFMLSARKPA